MTSEQGAHDAAMRAGEHVHEWWYQPPANPPRLFGDNLAFWFCNVGDHNGSIRRELDSGCREVRYTNPADVEEAPR